MRKTLSLLLITQYIISSLYINHRMMIGFSQETKTDSHCHETIENKKDSETNQEDNECFKTCASKDKLVSKTILIPEKKIKENPDLKNNFFTNSKKTLYSHLNTNYKFSSSPPKEKNRMLYNGFVGKATVLLL